MAFLVICIPLFLIIGIICDGTSRFHFKIITRKLSVYLPLSKQAKVSFFFFFYKIGEQEGGTGPSQDGGCYQWERGGGGERGYKGEYSTKSLYTCM
jgi:hypothetical protein